MVGALLSVTALLCLSQASSPFAGDGYDNGPDDLEGGSRISVVGGWRYTTNETFSTRAAEAGSPLVRPSPGGPQLTATFGYSPKSWLELAIDLFGGAERLRLEGRGDLTSITYGATVGVRTQTLIAQRWVPSFGISTGPILVYVRGGGLPEPKESLSNGYVVSGSLTYRVTESWGIALDTRGFIATRGSVPGLLTLNAGGLWAGIGVTYTFPRSASEPSSRSIGW